MKSYLLFMALFLSIIARGQTCLDSFHIKGYYIKVIPGQNYEKQKVTSFHFSDHTWYCYFLPFDSLSIDKNWEYWLTNHRLLEQNNFSYYEDWIIEKRVFESCGKRIKIPEINFPMRGTRYEIIEQNKEAIYDIIFIDGYWTKVRITNAERNLVGSDCPSHLCRKREDYDLYILTRLNSSSDSTAINEKGLQRVY